MDAWEEAVKEFNSKSVTEKLKLSRAVRDMTTGKNLIRLDGFVEAKSDMGLVLGDGNAYVYIWSHMGGDPFYVGSGVNDRWKDLHGRPDEFYAELDHGDAVLYKVVCGISVEDARQFERYISLALNSAGFVLTNKDNSPFKCGSERAAEWMCAFELKVGHSRRDEIYQVLDRIIRGEDFKYNEVVASKRFVRDNGSNYFSECFA